MVMTNLAHSSLSIREQLKEVVFPKAAEVNDNSAVEVCVAGSSSHDNGKIDPPLSPSLSQRHLLIALMTSFDSSLKRTSAELLFELCNCDSTYTS